MAHSAAPALLMTYATAHCQCSQDGVKKKEYSDRDVCRCYLEGLCPNDLFTNTVRPGVPETQTRECTRSSSLRRGGCFLMPEWWRERQGSLSIFSYRVSCTRAAPPTSAENGAGGLLAAPPAAAPGAHARTTTLPAGAGSLPFHFLATSLAPLRAHNRLSYAGPIPC